MKRSSLTILGCLLGAISFGQEPTEKFSFKAPAGPASAVLAELSKAAKTPMNAAGLVGSDVILLNLTDVTVSETMTKIAETLHAEWRKEGTGWVLYRGSNLESADQRAEAADRVAQFKKSLDEILDAQKKQGAFNDAAAKKLADANKKMMQELNRQSGNGGTFRFSTDFGNLENQTPASRAIAGILGRMSDSQLAALTNGKRVVFSLNPTRMQLAMPNGSQQILRQFIQEVGIYNNYNRRNEQAQNDGRMIVINGFGGDQAGDGDPKLGVGYAILTTQPGRAGANPFVTMLVADPNGKTIGSGQLLVGNFARMQPNAEAKAPANEKPIDLSPLAQEMAKLVGPGSAGSVMGKRVMTVAIGGSGGGAAMFTMADGEGGKTPVLSDELRMKILQPEIYDPLSFAPGELWSGYADSKGRDLIAYLPDSCFTPLNQVAAGGAVLPSALLSSAKNAAQLSVVDQDGWTLVSPKTPSIARTDKVNRIGLGNILKTLNRKQHLTLDEWATFASGQAKAPEENDFDNQYLRFINTPVAEYGISQFSFNGAWETLRFYASLSTAQRLALNQSGRVPMNTLSAYQVGLVSEQVFNSFDGPQVMNPGGPRNRAPRPMGFGETIERERTFLLPNGIGREGYVQFTLKNDNVVQAKSSQGGSEKFLSADSLAFERVRAQQPELVGFMNAPALDQFRMATQRTIGMLFQFTPAVSLSRQLEDNTPGIVPFAGYEQLPSDFRKVVDQRVDMFKQGFGRGGGGGQIPPPATGR